jgi:hypothetical protein
MLTGNRQIVRALSDCDPTQFMARLEEILQGAQVRGLLHGMLTKPQGWFTHYVYLPLAAVPTTIGAAPADPRSPLSDEDTGCIARTIDKSITPKAELRVGRHVSQAAINRMTVREATEFA